MTLSAGQLAMPTSYAKSTRPSLRPSSKRDASTLCWGRICWIGQNFMDNSVAHLEKYFTNKNMISLPMFLFADEIEHPPAADREKLSSLIPPTLGPLGANKADIYKALNFLCELEKGKYVVVNGERVIVRTFIGAFVGDIMEPQELSD
ncbi:hypothetical protein E4U33_004752 [Claviceps sp. LM78 group G4]|nr:hypothetical protein E4U33_004752 [Claviceps sp. LM78 group G4]